jgi:drug/metabolite transporter (DMT)-like permease
MPSEQIGQLAGLATSLCFTAGSTFFTLASRQIGPLALNRTRLLIALLFLSASHWIIFGAPFPASAKAAQWLWLGLSGVIGLALGDVFLFRGYTLVGPRLTMLMMSLSPILATALAWIFLGETLRGGQILGIGITLSGVTWVVSEGNHRTPIEAKTNSTYAPQYLRGILAGLGAAACQSVGLVLARQGLSEDFSALSGNFIRMFSAATAIWLLALVQGQVRQTLDILSSHPNALRFAAAGAFIAPFFGVSLSLVAIQNAAVGVASTLMALPPVFLLPVSVVVFKERLGWQAIVGTLAAIGGIALLFLV